MHRFHRFAFLFALLAACGQPGSDTPDAAAHSSADTGSASTSPDAAAGAPSDAGARPDATTGTLVQDLYQSGTRIKARMLVTADGAKDFRGWKDTQINEACIFVPTTEAKTRCLPSGDGRGWAAYFADSSCTSPAALVGAGCSTPNYLIAYHLECNQAVADGVYRSGSPTTTCYYKKPDGTCAPFPVATDQTVIPAAAQQPLTDFVEATETLE